MTNTFLIGQNAEETATNFLKEKGLEILERNYRNRFGEVDIVCRDGKQYVFVEVKAKNTSRFGKPYEMVTERKRLKLIRTSKSYLVEINLDIEKIDWRIDVVSLDNQRKEIEWLKNAVMED